jgi:hypothetical protein
MTARRWRWTNTEDGQTAPDPGREDLNRFRIVLADDRYVVRIESLATGTEYVIGSRRTLGNARRLAEEFWGWRR